MSVLLYPWKERVGGEDFHARYLLTNFGGINVEAGFAAEGDHQHTLLSLLGQKYCQDKLKMFERSSPVYELVEPVIEIFSDGSFQRV